MKAIRVHAPGGPESMKLEEMAARIIKAITPKIMRGSLRLFIR